MDSEVSLLYIRVFSNMESHRHYKMVISKNSTLSDVLKRFFQESPPEVNKFLFDYYVTINGSYIPEKSFNSRVTNLLSKRCFLNVSMPFETNVFIHFEFKSSKEDRKRLEQLSPLLTIPSKLKTIFGSSRANETTGTIHGTIQQPNVTSTINSSVPSEDTSNAYSSSPNQPNLERYVVIPERQPFYLRLFEMKIFRILLLLVLTYAFLLYFFSSVFDHTEVFDILLLFVSIGILVLRNTLTLPVVRIKLFEAKKVIGRVSHNVQRSLFRTRGLSRFETEESRRMYVSRPDAIGTSLVKALAKGGRLAVVWVVGAVFALHPFWEDGRD